MLIAPSGSIPRQCAVCCTVLAPCYNGSIQHSGENWGRVAREPRAEHKHLLDCKGEAEELWADTNSTQGARLSHSAPKPAIFGKAERAQFCPTKIHCL